MARVTHGSILLVFAVALAACAARRPPADEAPAAGAERNGCEQDISLVCEAGFVDGCLQAGAGGAPLTLVHVCVAEAEKPGPPCAQEIARECPDGQVDACLTAPPAATTHVCVVPVDIP